jgi:demethylmenaquinone methyltransferase/2-methoxy-6-polyprenyl-1,4-benzoquinol methylase
VAEEGPNRAEAIERYRKAASGYDRRMRLAARWQRQAVERLGLRPGETVIDVACGTGLNFPLLESAVGPSGRVVGIDLSPEMLALAAERFSAEGWQNVTLIEAPVEEAELDQVADAALFSFTHDVLQSPAAVANVVDHLRPGGRFACVGPKLAGRWGFPVNLVVRRIARLYVTTLRGVDRPWRELERHAETLEHRSLALGGLYVAWGTVRSKQQDAPG